MNTKVVTNELAIIFNSSLVIFLKEFATIPDISKQAKVYFRTDTMTLHQNDSNSSSVPENIYISMHQNIVSVPVPNSDILINVCVSLGFNTNLQDDYKLIINSC